jgi:hypothetical protein
MYMHKGIKIDECRGTYQNTYVHKFISMKLKLIQEDAI